MKGRRARSSLPPLNAQNYVCNGPRTKVRYHGVLPARLRLSRPVSHGGQELDREESMSWRRLSTVWNAVLHRFGSILPGRQWAELSLITVASYLGRIVNAEFVSGVIGGKCGSTRGWKFCKFVEKLNFGALWIHRSTSRWSVKIISWGFDNFFMPLFLWIPVE